jgi:hypothetical protein
MQRRGQQRRAAPPSQEGGAHTSSLAVEAGTSDDEPLLGRRPTSNARRRDGDGIHRSESSGSRNASIFRGVRGDTSSTPASICKTLATYIVFGVLLYFYLTRIIYVNSPLITITEEGYKMLSSQSQTSAQGDEAAQFARLYLNVEQKLEQQHLQEKKDRKRKRDEINKRVYDQQQATKDLADLERKQAASTKKSKQDAFAALTSTETTLMNPEGKDGANSAIPKNATSSIRKDGVNTANSTTLSGSNIGVLLSRNDKRRQKRDSLLRLHNNTANVNVTRSLTPEDRAKMQEDLMRESIQALMVLVSSFLFCVAMRLVASRYIDPNSIHPSRAGGRAMAQSIRQRQRERQRERFNNLVRRLNAARTANGERPISTQSLRLVVSDRNFTGDDYESLLQFNEENGHSLESILHHSMGATDREIERCPAHTIESQNDFLLQSPSQSAVPPKACSVCLETYKIGDEVRTIPCFHTFHTKCIDPWLRQKAECPVCKHSAIG